MLEQNDNNSIIKDLNDFVERSARRYSTVLSRAVNDMRIYSGDFWTSEFMKNYNRKGRHNLSLSNWAPLCNAIASPISASPWHVELVDREGPNEDVQQGIDQIESDTDTKSALIDSFRKCVLTGNGFLVMSTVEDEITGEPKIVLESVQNLGSVALDPAISTVDGSDAEEGAIVNYISVQKARRLYGEDVVPPGYPKIDCNIRLPINQWLRPEGSVPLVSYYKKNDQGTVDLYKMCGNKVVDVINLPIKYIPILRLAGNEIYENDQINYNGIVQQTLSLELGANIAYSTLIERCGRSPKANYLVHVDAWDGLEEHNAQLNQDDTLAVMWKGEHEPKPIIESFQTGDLQATISTCRTLMEDTLGIPLTGIIDKRERTATEILRQETSKESNTASYYNNAYKTMRTLGRIFIELLTGGNDLRFTLENGPSVITRQMKQRQELTAMATVMTDEMKPILAKYFADTLKDEIGEDLSKNIVANLPTNLKLIQGNEDPNAVHMLNQMQAAMDETNAMMDQVRAENEQLKQQLMQSQLSLMENREQRALDWNKFTVSEQNKLAIETAKLGQNAAKIENEAADDEEKNFIKASEVAIKAAESDMNRQEEKTDAYIQGADDMKRVMR